MTRPDDAREILLRSDKYGEMTAIVDAADQADIIRYTWHVERSCHTFYASRNAPAGSRPATVGMHTHILGRVPGLMVDHVDGNGLHNWRLNLRRATKQQQQWNRVHFARDGKTSRFKGVCWRRDIQRWQAYRGSSGSFTGMKRIHLGHFIEEQAAAIAYDAAARHHFGEFAALNFPE